MVDKYTVFIIGGQNKNNEFLNSTWMAEFDVVPDQVKHLKKYPKSNKNLKIFLDAYKPSKHKMENNSWVS